MTRASRGVDDRREALAAAAVEDRHDGAGAEPQHARQMSRLVGRQVGLGRRRIEIGREKTRADAGRRRRHSRYTAMQSPAPTLAPSIVGTRHSPLLFKGQTLGKYRIIAPLGSGGFGTVYLAQDTWIDKKVAIKVPHRQNLDFGELLREPRLLASVSHPNIVAITTAEKQDGVFFIVMEYVPGETLENIIALKGAIELPRALDFTCQICNAMDHAHRQGVMHRDLRPANVLIGENDMLKVADFGTSRFLEIAAHGTTVIGSPPYMAPEQFHGKAVFASDIYSLGVTMYQMLTGTLPYDTPAPADLAKLMSGELVKNPRLAEPGDPQGDQRHHPAGDGARRDRALRARLGPARRRARRTHAAAARAGRRRPARSPRSRLRRGRRERIRPAFRAGCVIATRRPPASAGSAASRCTPAPIAARSATKRSKREPAACTDTAGAESSALGLRLKATDLRYCGNGVESQRRPLGGATLRACSLKPVASSLQP